MKRVSLGNSCVVRMNEMFRFVNGYKNKLVVIIDIKYNI